MKNLKQLIAFTTIASLALTMVGVGSVKAAGNVAITTTTTDGQVITIDLPEGVDLAAGNNLTVNIEGADFSASGAITAFTVGGISGTITGDNDGNIAVSSLGGDPVDGADIVITLATPLDANHAYAVTYSDSQSNEGTSFVFYQAGDTVQVSATVEPTLSLVLTDTAVDLGVLSTGDISESVTEPTATVATNATGGFTLSVADLDGHVGLYSTTADKLIGATGNNSTKAGTEGFDIVVSGAGTETAFSSTGTGVITGSNQAIASSTGPVAANVSTINVRAAISGTTPAASDYTTTLTFTATGTF